MATQLRLVGEEEEPVAESSSPVQAIFEFWRVVMEKPRAQLGPARRRRIDAALSMGYSVDDLRLAIVGCKYDNWSQGQNDRGMKFDDLELICRDETKIDRYMELGDVYMRKTASRDLKLHEAQQAGTPMPDHVRSRLDALFSKLKGGGEK